MWKKLVLLLHLHRASDIFFCTAPVKGLEYPTRALYFCTDSENGLSIPFKTAPVPPVGRTASSSSSVIFEQQFFLEEFFSSFSTFLTSSSQWFSSPSSSIISPFGGFCVLHHTGAQEGGFRQHQLCGGGLKSLLLESLLGMGASTTSTVGRRPSVSS